MWLFLTKRCSNNENIRSDYDKNEQLVTAPFAVGYPLGRGQQAIVIVKICVFVGSRALIGASPLVRFECADFGVSAESLSVDKCSAPVADADHPAVKQATGDWEDTVDTRFPARLSILGAVRRPVAWQSPS